MRVIDMFPLNEKDGEIGIEVEMEGDDLPQLIDQGQTWRVMNDGSLRGNEAYEYILRRPVARDKVTAAFVNLNAEFKSHASNLKPSDRCGVHVHINCQQLTFDEVMRFIVLYLCMENILVRFCGESREGNLFCLRARDAEYLIQGLIRCVKNQGFGEVQSDYYRYGSVNPNALSKFGSLEFRAMQTPENFSEIETWINLLTRIKDAALMFDSPSAIIEGMSERGAAVFIRLVLGDAAELVECEDQDKLLTEGVRLVQDLAYAKAQNVKIKKRPVRHRQPAQPEWHHIDEIVMEELDLEGEGG